MAKTSHKRPPRHERAQAGCIRGIMSIFDFRHGRFTKRLLSDRSRVNKQVPTRESQSIVDAEESKMPIPMPDVAMSSVKELMEEEMFNEQGSEDCNDSGTGLERSNSNNGRKHQKKRSRSHIKSSDLDLLEQLMPESFNQVTEKRPFDNLDLETIIGQLAHLNQRNANAVKNDCHVDLDIPSGQAVTVVEEKLVAALKLLTEQGLSCSKRFGEDVEFMDALKTLSLYRGVLLKLLEDPSSKLVKLVQNLEDARLDSDQLPNSPVSNSSEDKPGNLKKSRNFFRRRTKSMESYPLGGDSCNKIVILKPEQGGAQSPQTLTRISSLRLQSPNMDEKVQTDRNTSPFSFTEIKRKLRNAMGKERGFASNRHNLKYSPKHQNSNNGDKRNNGENLGWSSPNRNHFYTERFLTPSHSFKKGEPIGKLNDIGSISGNATSQNSRLYVEAKKHLSEMLKNGGENPESVTRQLPKPLGRVLSLPEYNASPCCISPRKYGDDIFITTQIRSSPRAIVKNDLSGENRSNCSSPRKQRLQSQPDISGGNSEDRIRSLDTNDDDNSCRDDQEHSVEIDSVTEDALDPEAQSSPAVVVDMEETTNSEPDEGEEIISSSSESTSEDNDKKEVVDDTQLSSQFMKDSSLCFVTPLSGEDQILSSLEESPSRCPVSTETEDPECVRDKIGRPSPVSVLEPLFTDGDDSPASPITEPVEIEIQPRHIHFEEEQSSASDQICTRISLEDEESAFEYVEAVLLGSGLNWDELLLRWISMYEILDPSLFDEVEAFSSRPRHDQKLLFDCANDALREVCETYFGCFAKMNMRPAPTGMDLIQAIWQHVERRLLQVPEPHSLEHLVKAEMERSREWMNLQSDIDLVVCETVETIFDDLVSETVVTFANDIHS